MRHTRCYVCIRHTYYDSINFDFCLPLFLYYQHSECAVNLDLIWIFSKKLIPFIENVGIKQIFNFIANI